MLVSPRSWHNCGCIQCWADVCPHDRDILGCRRCACRTELLSAVTLPVLELEGKEITLSYLRAAGADYSHTGPPAQFTDVPDGFIALWLRSNHVSVAKAGHLGLGSVPSHSVDVADEMCRFLSLTPESYREFRLHTHGSHPVFQTDWQALPGDSMDRSMSAFRDQQVVASSMRQVADAYGLAVSVSADQTHVHVVRVQAPQDCQLGRGVRWAAGAAGY